MCGSEGSGAHVSSHHRHIGRCSGRSSRLATASALIAACTAVSCIGSALAFSTPLRPALSIPSSRLCSHRRDAAMPALGARLGSLRSCRNRGQSVCCMKQDKEKEEVVFDEANMHGVIQDNLPTIEESPEEAVVDGYPPGTSIEIWVTRATILFVAFLYGTNFGCVKILGNNMEPSLAAAVRFTIAAVTLSPFLVGMRKEVLYDACLIGFWVTLGYVAQAVGLETVDASKAAFLCALIVVVCPALDAMNGSKVTALQWSSAALAVLGAAYLELGGQVQPTMGDFFALMQPVGFGWALWKCEKTLAVWPDQGGALTAFQLVVTALVSWAWTLYDFQGFPSSQDFVNSVSNMEVTAALLWTGFVTTALTVFLQTTSVGKITSSEATVLISTEPIWGAAFASVILGEVIGPNAIIGGGLIVTACISSIIDPNLVTAQRQLGKVQLMKVRQSIREKFNYDI